MVPSYLGEPKTRSTVQRLGFNVTAVDPGASIHTEDCILPQEPAVHTGTRMRKRTQHVSPCRTQTELWCERTTAASHHLGVVCRCLRRYFTLHAFGGFHTGSAAADFLTLESTF